MLEPKEIDKYFHAPSSSKKAKEVTLKHTRWVTLIKLALPGLAAVLAVTLLVFPSLNDDIRDFGLNFSFGKGDMEKLNIEKTTVYVTDKQNRISNFEAEQIKETSAGSKIFDLSRPEAILPMDDNEWLSIQAPQGVYNQKNTLLHLQKQVEGFYSPGMSLLTEEAFINFRESFGYGHRPVKGEGFLGKISAEGFEVSGKRNTLTFLGKTRLLIDEETLQKE